MPVSVSKKPILTKEAQKAWNRLNRRQRAFCVAYFDCPNAAEAYRKAGYEAEAFNSAAAGAWRLLNDPDVQAVINGMLEAYKLTPELAARKLQEGLEASETRFFAHEGAIFAEREVIAWPTRMQALDMLHKILGKYKMTVPPEGYTGPLVYLPKGVEPGEMTAIEVGVPAHGPSSTQGNGTNQL